MSATNFFERQESARKRTWLLVFLFILSVVAVAVSAWPALVGCCIFCFYLGALYVWFTEGDWDLNFCMEFVDGIQYTDGWLIAAFFVGGAILFVTLYKIDDLKKLGACGVAEKLGGTRIDRSATAWDEKRFYNVVEETALACGVPVPAVYVLRDEDGINACAIGGDVGNSAIAATAGAIRYLDRDELQGVVAHEFAHIVNADVKLNMRLIGVLFGLQALAIAGLAGLQAECARRGKKEGSAAPLWFALILLGTVGCFVGEMIRAAISRQREFLADESATQFTRYPAGLAGALKKIGGLEKGSTVSAPVSAETAHLFFGSVFSGGFWTRLFRTHPDLTERILALEPTFDGNFPKSDDVRAAKSAEERRAKAEKIQKKQKGRKGQTSTRPQLPTLDGAAVASALVASVGALRPEKLDGVLAIFREIPAAVETLLEDFDGARLVLFALLTDVDAWGTFTEQRDAICRRDSEAFYRRVVVTSETLRALPFSVRAAIARLAVPTLKSGKVDDYKRCRETVFALCDADGRRDLFEFALQASVIRELDVWFRLAPFPKTKFSAFSDVREAFQTAATELAVRGASGDEAAARRAFAAGVSALGDVAKSTEPLEPQGLENVDLETFYEAVERLAQSTPLLKEKLLTAFFACVAADGRVTEAEAELFDAISLALGVPAPVWRSVVDASVAAS